MGWEQDLYGNVYKSQKTKNAAAKRKKTNEAKSQRQAAAYDHAFTSGVKSYASQNNLQYSDDLKQAAKMYYQNKDSHEKFVQDSVNESKARNRRELKSYASFASNEDGQDKIKEYNEARKKMGMQPDNMVTKKKYDQMFGYDTKRGSDSGMINRYQQYLDSRNSKDMKVNHNEKKSLGASFDKKVDNGLNGLTKFIGKVKNSKLVQGAEDLAKKIDDTKIGHAYVKTAEELFKHSPVGDKIQGMKTMNEAMPLVDKYGGAASTRNVLADLTDKKNQTAKQYIEDIKGGFTGKKNTKGEEIARNLGVQSKYGGKASGLGIELLADPTNFIPAGIAGKVLKSGSKLAKLAKEGQVTGEAIKAADIESIIAKSNKTGKMSKSDSKKLLKFTQEKQLKEAELQKVADEEAKRLDPSAYPKNIEGLHIIKDEYPMDVKASLQKANEAIKNPVSEAKLNKTLSEAKPLTPQQQNLQNIKLPGGKIEVQPTIKKSLNDFINQAKTKQTGSQELITPKTVNQKPIDYVAQKNELSAIHEADRQQFAAQNKDVIDAVSSERQRAVDQFNKEDMEWQGHEAAAKQYDDIMKSVGGRLNIPANNMNDFASQMGKHMYSAAGKGQGDDIYKVADDLGFNNPDELIQTLNNGYASKQIVKAGKNKFYSVDGKKLQDPNPETIIDEMHAQTPSSQQLRSDMAKMDQLHNEQQYFNKQQPVTQAEQFLNAATKQKENIPVNVLSKEATPSQKIQMKIEKATRTGKQEDLKAVENERLQMIKELEKFKDHDEQAAELADELKGLKLNLQTFAGKEQINPAAKALEKLAKINKEYESFLNTRKTAEEIQRMTPVERIEHEVQKHEANVDYLDRKINEIDEAIHTASKHDYLQNIDPLVENSLKQKDRLEAKLINAQQKLELTKEFRSNDDLQNLQNRTDFKTIVKAFVKPMRLMERTFGKDSTVYKKIFDNQQTARVYHQELNNKDYDVIKGIRSLIGKKKKDSAFLQDWGEKTLLKDELKSQGMSEQEIGKLPKEQLNKMNEELLKRLRPNDYQNFIESDKMARTYYNDKIDTYNKVMAETYPNDSDKLITKREDYYHHFNEMGDGLVALFNRLKQADKVGKISPQLEGLSKFTRPATQWVGQKMARLGGAYTSDAIGGMVKTSHDLNKAIAWTPQVGMLRKYKDVMSTATENTRNINNMLNAMDSYANKLANKSGDMDRWVADNAASRVGLEMINGMSNLIKNNLLGYSFRTLFAQGLTIPHAFARAKTENIVKAIPDTFRYLMKNEGPASKSPFLMERLGTKNMQDFKSGLSKLVEYGHFMPQIADKASVPLFWNGIYKDVLKKYKGQINGNVIPDHIEKAAIDETDKLVSEIVGGRGVGDKSFAQESKVYQLFDPFQLEPQSQLTAMSRMFGGLKDGIKNKDTKQILNSSRHIGEFLGYSYVVGMAFQYLTGSDAALNPIEDIKKGIKEGGTIPQKGLYAARNLAGDAATSGGLPLAQTIALLSGMTGKNSQTLFGKEDPFRFATNGVLVAKPFQEMLNGSGLSTDDGNGLQKLINHLPASILLPTGEGPFIRGKKGFQATNEGGVYSKNHPEKMMYPVGNDFMTRIKAMTMGVNATKNAQKYWEQDTPTALSDSQTLKVLNGKSAEDRQKAFDKIMSDKKKNKKGPSKSTINKHQKLFEDIQKKKQGK